MKLTNLETFHLAKRFLSASIGCFHLSLRLLQLCLQLFLNSQSLSSLSFLLLKHRFKLSYLNIQKRKCKKSNVGEKGGLKFFKHYFNP